MNIKSQIDKQIETLRKGQKLLESQVKALCLKAKQILMEEGNVIKLEAPVTICGDIHGQFFDLLELFKIGGQPPFTNYLFLGDFVDRGNHSIQTFELLVALKIKYKSRITLIRGNHQSRQITQVYGFYDQCLRKYGSLNVWKYCTDVFDCIPLAAVIGQKILCVHGGLSPNISSIDEIRSLQRKQQVPHDGPMCDLMWSDPDQISGWTISPRGAGYLFGSQVTQKFNRSNNISLICRAHQLVMQGYKKIFNNKLVTVWSAPNYCYRCGNVAAILQLDQTLQQYYKIFDAAAQDGKNKGRIVPQYFL